MRKSCLSEDQLQEKLLKFGATVLSDTELLAILLRTGTRSKNAMELSQELLCHFGSLHKIFHAESDFFSTIPGFGKTKFCEIKAIMELSQRYWHEKIREHPIANNSAAVKEFLRRQLQHHSQEVFGCLFLNAKFEILQFEKLFFGNFHQAFVHPREIVKRALHHQAAAVILAHNHPSGDPTPSNADLETTTLIKNALLLIDVQTYDHIITGDDAVFSFAENGRI